MQTCACSEWKNRLIKQQYIELTLLVCSYLLTWCLWDWILSPFHYCMYLNSLQKLNAVFAAHHLFTLFGAGVR